MAAEAPTYPTISPGELRIVLDLLSKAPTTIGDGFVINGLLNRLVTLVNQPHPIGAVVSVEAKPEEAALSVEDLQAAAEA